VAAMGISKGGHWGAIMMSIHSDSRFDLRLIGMLGLLTGCSSVTVFQSSFASSLGAPPAHSQTVGTVDVSGATGSITVVAPPPTAPAGQNWVQILRTDNQAPVPAMECNLSQSQAEASYSISASIFIPAGSGLATVEFDTGSFAAPSLIGFFHLDFLQDGTMRLDDNAATIFGSVPHGQYFSLFMTLNVTASAATVHVGVLGNGASGSTDYTVPSPLTLAQQFGAVKFWMGFPWTGSFDVVGITVARNAS
jgi:hypothetical protein